MESHVGRRGLWARVCGIILPCAIPRASTALFVSSAIRLLVGTSSNVTFLHTTATHSQPPLWNTKTVYLREVRAALERDGEEEDVEGEVAKVFGRGEYERVPMGFETWLAMARGEKDDEEDTSVFEMLGNGKVRCRCRLVDGRVCAGKGFAPEWVAQHFSNSHPRSVFRVNCVVCKEDVASERISFKRHLLQSHSDVFTRGCDWLRVYSSLVRSALDKRSASESVIVRELQLLRESERAPSSFAGWLLRAQKEREEGSGCGAVSIMC